MKQRTMQKAAEEILHRAGIADRVGDIGMFRPQPPSRPRRDWILSDLVGDAERGQGRRADQRFSGEGGKQAPANEACLPRVFLGSGDRGIYGFASAPGKRLPSSLLFAIDGATLCLRVQRGLLSSVLVLTSGPDIKDVVLRGNRFGSAGATAAIAAICRLISAAAPKEA
jgi:hypothetical protein